VSLPPNEKLFLNELKMYFQNFYDCKELMRELTISGGLTKVARGLGVDRIGTMHQAGSDAHLTSVVYF
jgi:CCR4-NOT transcription complex subunit 7/8